MIVLPLSNPSCSSLKSLTKGFLPKPVIKDLIQSACEQLLESLHLGCSRQNSLTVTQRDHLCNRGRSEYRNSNLRAVCE